MFRGPAAGTPHGPPPISLSDRCTAGTCWGCYRFMFVKVLRGTSVVCMKTCGSEPALLWTCPPGAKIRLQRVRESCEQRCPSVLSSSRLSWDVSPSSSFPGLYGGKDYLFRACSGQHLQTSIFTPPLGLMELGLSAREEASVLLRADVTLRGRSLVV